MNIEALKSGFREYLEKNNLFDAKDILKDDKDISIFMHANEFKDYLAQEYDADSSVLKGNILDILSLKIVDGKLVDEKDVDNENSQILDELQNQTTLQDGKTEPTTEVPDGEEPIDTEPEDGETPPEEEQVPDKNEELDGETLLNEVLNDLLQDEDFKAALDLDKDGEINEDELKGFLEKINEFDLDNENLSLDDLAIAIDKIKDGSFTLDDEAELQEAQTPETVEQNQPVEQTSAPRVSQYSAPSGRSSYSNGSYSAPRQTQAPTIENMDLEQLKAEKEVREQKVTEAQDEINSITSGEKFASEESEVESLKQDYLEAVKEELSEEDKNTLQTHIENIDNKEKEIDESNKKIADYDIKISDQENTVSNIETTLASLKQTQAQLNSTSTDDEEKRSQIETKKREIAQKISELENQKTEENNNLQTLKDEKKETEDNLTTQQGELEELKTTKQEFEESIKEKLSDTAKEKMEAYNNAKDNLETKKAQALSEAQGNLATAQAAVKEVDAKINEKEAQEASKEFSPSPFMQYNEQRGQSLAQAALELFGNDHVANGYCAAGVSKSINRAFGYATSGNGCDYGNVLANRSDWVEITQEITDVEQLKNLPAGAIVSWSQYESGHTASGGAYGHVFISDGQGHEISDYIANVGTYYYDWGASYRVFLPT